jgi:hypothetical protein
MELANWKIRIAKSDMASTIFDGTEQRSRTGVCEKFTTVAA